MTGVVKAPLVHSTVRNAEACIEQATSRLDAILSEPELTADLLVELTAIFNNISYLFLYLEANDDHVNFKRLLSKRDAFYRNPALDARILEKLRACRFGDRRLERSRIAYLRQLEEKDTNDVSDCLLETLKKRAKCLNDASTEKQAKQLTRLGFSVSGKRPSTIFYQILRRTENSSTREKLARVWSLSGTDHLNEMGAVVDEMITVRRMRAAVKDATPLGLTLRKCRVDETTVSRFLDNYLDRAVVEHRKLEEEIARAVGVRTEPLAHFSYFLRQKFGCETAPMFDLDRCLDYIFAVAKAILNLDFSITQDAASPVIIADVSRFGEPIGSINFDLWSNHGKNLGANHTLGLRNRASWGEIVQRPEAWVSCRFEPRNGTHHIITFQNVHSLYHEFGHAINHLLIREEIPNQSGLEYLPLERLEYLSMWFEKWVYHPAFGRHLGLTQDKLHGLWMCQEAKKTEYRRTYLERALSAVLDFECHRRDVTLNACFNELQRRHGIKHCAEFTDFPPYFIWPMYMANPGASFVYLWGAAWSCEHFLPLAGRSLPEITGLNNVPARLNPCFDFDLPSSVPEHEMVFDFYRATETRVTANVTGAAS